MDTTFREPSDEASCPKPTFQGFDDSHLDKAGKGVGFKLSQL